MVKIRLANTHDVKQIVDIHLDAFEGFFLTSLGKDFLLFYYDCFIKSNETVSVVAEDETGIIGFSASTSICKGFNGRLIKNNLIQFALLSFKLLFTTPKSLLRLVKNLTKKNESREDPEDYAELYSIGVLSSRQHEGIGGKLIAETEVQLKAKGVSKVSLTTDYYKNDTTINFYRNHGFDTLYEFITYPNRKMLRLIKNI